MTHYREPLRCHSTSCRSTSTQLLVQLAREGGGEGPRWIFFSFFVKGPGREVDVRPRKTQSKVAEVGEPGRCTSRASLPARLLSSPVNDDERFGFLEGFVYRQIRATQAMVIGTFVLLVHGQVDGQPLDHYHRAVGERAGTASTMIIM